MENEEDIDSYLVNTDYNLDYPLGGLPLSAASNISPNFPTSNIYDLQAHKAYTSMSDLESFHKSKTY